MIPEIAHTKMVWTNLLRDGNWIEKELTWGDPLSNAGTLGYYSDFMSWLVELCDNKTVLEIGCWAGKWLNFIDPFRYIGVDIIEGLGANLCERFPTQNINYYLGEGNEMRGIASGSVDVVFSVDALMRSSEDIVYAYIRESFRVLKTGGIMILMLPDDTKDESRKRNFTPLNLTIVAGLTFSAGFKNVSLDDEMFNHGSLLIAKS